MEKDFQHERTLIIIKPDGVQRTLVGEIIKRYERVGLKLIAMKMVLATPEHMHKHYTVDPEWPRKTGEKTIASYNKKGITPPSDNVLEISNAILENLKKYMTSGPVIVMVWQGAHAVPLVRKITGGTEPLSSDVGTIRGDFVLDSYEMSDSVGRSIRNLLHASGSVEDAEKEIALWFTSEEIYSYRLVQEEILYDVNLDGTKE